MNKNTCCPLFVCVNRQSFQSQKPIHEQFYAYTPFRFTADGKKHAYSTNSILLDNNLYVVHTKKVQEQNK